jgi:hypothetical protein
MRAIRSEISSADCPRLPSSSKSAVSDASPACSGASAEEPPGIRRTVAATGTEWWETARMCSPLAS